MNDDILNGIKRNKDILLDIYENHPDMVKFLDNLDNGVIPETLDFSNTPYNKDHLFSFSRENLIKQTAQIYCMYGKVAVEICKSLKEHIKDKKVLEVMAGRGWLAKGLREQGVDIIATDDYSWLDNNWNPVTDVERLDALNAIKKYKNDVDILLISWPYMDNTAYQCLKEYSDKKQVIFIGEINGCTADEDFANNFIVKGKLQNYQSWDMLRDQIYFGKARKNKKILKYF